MTRVWRVLAVALAIAYIALAISCGHKANRSLIGESAYSLVGASGSAGIGIPSPTTSDGATASLGSGEPAASWLDSLDDIARTAAVLKDIAEYKRPADVDCDVFEMLRAELVRQMCDKSRNTQAEPFPIIPSRHLPAPLKVSDLRMSNGKLIWTYWNFGDYNLDGEVNVADITPIAQNYQARPDDGIGNDAYERWLVLDLYGTVSVPLITHIAENYLNTVKEYALMTSRSAAGDYASLESPVPLSAAQGMPLVFKITLPESALDYIVIATIDDYGTTVETSDPIEVLKPNMISIEPQFGLSGMTHTFSADCYGVPPFSYEWSFEWLGYDKILEPTLQVELPAVPGIYQVEVTIKNKYGVGSTTDNAGPYRGYFEVLGPPLIGGISFNYLFSGSTVKFDAPVVGTSPREYLWRFGGGVNPDESDDISPTVTANSSPGVYNGTLVVSNMYGEAVSDFQYEIDGRHWRSEILDSSQTKDFSFCINSDDTFHIAMSNGNIYYLSKRDGGWIKDSVSAFEDFCYRCDITTDNDGTPLISYFNTSNNTVDYAILGEGGWDIQTVVPEISLFNAYSKSLITMDVSGEPIIVYWDGGWDYDRRFARIIGGDWKYERYPGNHNNAHPFLVDTKGVIHIFPYFGGDDGLATLIHQRYIYSDEYDTYYATAEVLSNVVYPGVCIDALFDDTANIHITYTADEKLYYGINSSSGEYSEEVILSGAWAQFCYRSLQLDSAGKPYIVFCRNNPDGYYLSLSPITNYLAFKDNDKWHIAPFGEEISMFQLQFDSQDVPHIVYTKRTDESLNHAWLE